MGSIHDLLYVINNFDDSVKLRVGGLDDLYDEYMERMFRLSKLKEAIDDGNQSVYSFQLMLQESKCDDEKKKIKCQLLECYKSLKDARDGYKKFTNNKEAVAKVIERTQKLKYETVDSDRFCFGLVGDNSLLYYGKCGSVPRVEYTKHKPTGNGPKPDTKLDGAMCLD